MVFHTLGVLGHPTALSRWADIPLPTAKNLMDRGIQPSNRTMHKVVRGLKRLAAAREREGLSSVPPDLLRNEVLWPAPEDRISQGTVPSLNVMPREVSRKGKK
jgi:hypothetical protein